MIHFIIGRAGTGKSAAVRERIREDLAEGRQTVLIVPEQQTVVWETRMAEELPESANLRLEITNFTRLANSVFREYGGLTTPVADNGSRLLLTWRAMLSVWNRLTVYGGDPEADPGTRKTGRNTRREDRAVPHLLSAIDDLKSAGISPAEAERALDSLRLAEPADETDPAGDPANDEHRENRGNRGSLTDRLSDAVLVYAAYDELLHRTAVDRGDLLQILAETLDEHPYFRGKSVYLDSFFSLTAPEERLLARIMRQADEVTVTFACPPKTGNQPDDGELQFGETREFLKSASRLAARAGKEVEKIALTENHRHKAAPDLAAVEQYLFRYAESLPSLTEESSESEGGECVRVIRCADRFDEAEACASLIDRLIREGYRYSDVAVVARNMKTREGLLDPVLRRHGIACFLSESSEISTSPAVRLISAALQVIDGGWQRTDVIRLMKTGLTPVNLPPEPEKPSEPEQMTLFEQPDDDQEEQTDAPAAGLNPGDVFELYTDTWNIRGRRLYTAERWTMNPDGYKIEVTETGQRILALANQAKDRLIPPLNRLAQVFDNGAADVRTIAEALVLFAEEYGAVGQLEEAAEAYEAIGMPADAAKLRQSWPAVCRILDKMVAVLASDEDNMTYLDAGRFAGLFSKVAQQMDVGSIPTAADEVVLGSSSGVRFDEVKCVILLGCTEGEFPGTVSGTNGFFDDRDREALEAVGLTLGIPDAALQTAREAFMYYRSAASASEKLYILAPAGESGELSEGARRVVQILEKRGRHPVSVFGNMPLSEIVYHPATAEYLLSRRSDPADQRLLLSLVGADRTAEVPLTAEHDRLIPSPEYRKGGQRGSHPEKMSLTQTSIESFVSCPFNYTCQYRMKVRPQPKAEIQTPDVGTFIHHVLEHFFRALPKEKLDALPLPWEEVERLADGIIRGYLDDLARASGHEEKSPALQDGRLQYLFVRLRRHVLVFLEAIMGELAQSRFRPAAYEQPIGRSGDPQSVRPITFRTSGGTEVTLRGVADRVDLYKVGDGREYLRIVDYKTGVKTFSLENVAKGLDVQLLIYLFSVWKYGLPNCSAGGERIPAGAVYFSIRPAAVSSKTLLTAEEAKKLSIEKIERSGVYLGEEEVLDAMDAGLSGKYVSAKKNSKTGEIVGSKSASLLSANEFGLLCAQLETVIGRIAGQMSDGHAEARPRLISGKSPCDWCRNRFICKRR